MYKYISGINNYINKQIKGDLKERLKDAQFDFLTFLSDKNYQAV